MFLFYAVHYPHPEKVELLIRSMREVGELIKKQPGLVLVDTFQDPDNGTLLGVSLWESRDAFRAAMPALQDAFPPEDWEVKPREVHMLESAV
jgi:quinol monooxygenase YgiN